MVLAQSYLGSHGYLACPPRVWVVQPRTMALAKCGEVPETQTGHVEAAEQVYLRAQGLNPSSWG